MAAPTITPTKDLGYSIVKSQQSIALGIDIEKTVTPGSEKYMSVNTEEMTDDTESNTNTIYPLDENGGVTTETSKTVAYTLTHNYNKLNPTHLFFSKVAKSGKLGENIPCLIVDNVIEAYQEGKCNIIVKENIVGGETRTQDVTFSIIGNPDWLNKSDDSVLTK